MIRRARAPFAVLAATAALAACTLTAVLDDERLQQEIQTGFAAQTGLTVQAVDCPDDQPLAAGATFECSLTTADGQTFTIRVTQVDAQGNVNWELVQD